VLTTSPCGSCHSVSLTFPYRVVPSPLPSTPQGPDSFGALGHAGGSFSAASRPAGGSPGDEAAEAGISDERARVEAVTAAAEAAAAARASGTIVAGSGLAAATKLRQRPAGGGVQQQWTTTPVDNRPTGTGRWAKRRDAQARGVEGGKVGTRSRA